MEQKLIESEYKLGEANKRAEIAEEVAQDKENASSMAHEQNARMTDEYERVIQQLN